MAPKERSLIQLFSERGNVVFGDISPEQFRDIDVQRVDLMDMSSLGLFDVIFVSHVMEHVPDDRQVFRSILDRLSPGGEAWILVPLHDGPTVEGAPDMSPLQRERRFGKWDHLRQYGPDIADRMKSLGFNTSVVGLDRFSADETHRYGLWVKDKIFVGRR
jgi:SAM-dependent methyltransferase